MLFCSCSETTLLLEDVLKFTTQMHHIGAPLTMSFKSSTVLTSGTFGCFSSHRQTLCLRFPHGSQTDFGRRRVEKVKDFPACRKSRINELPGSFKVFPWTDVCGLPREEPSQCTVHFLSAAFVSLAPCLIPAGAGAVQQMVKRYGQGSLGLN